MRCKNCNSKIMRDVIGWFHPVKAVNWNNRKKDCPKAEPKVLFKK